MYMYRQLAEILVQCLGCASLTAELLQAEKGEVFIRRRAPEGTGSQGYTNTTRFEHLLAIVTHSHLQKPQALHSCQTACSFPCA